MPLKFAPRVLAFDTSSARASTVLLEGNEVLAELRLHAPQTHSTVLLNSINFLLDQLDWTLADLNLVAVGIGPGSFTGIRIGLSTALGIAQSLSIPLAGISGLDALAHQASSLEGRICVLLDAHRSQVFFAEYLCRQGRIRRTERPILISLSDLDRRLADRHLYIVGDLEDFQVKDLRSLHAGKQHSLAPDLFLAKDIGRLALSQKRKWRSGEYLMCEPLYIRPPDAIRNKTRKR